MDDIKKKYRQLSILLHPDKNPDDKDRAQAAFDIVKKANEALKDDSMRTKALAIVNEAKEMTDAQVGRSELFRLFAMENIIEHLIDYYGC